MSIYIKQNRFTGEKYKWTELGGRSDNCTHTFMNGVKMSKEEQEEFKYMIANNKEYTLSCGGQFQYTIEG
jgi:hypothetical protein